MKPWHAITVNGGLTFEVTDSYEFGCDRIRRMLERLDGKEGYSLVLWPMPAGKRLDELDPHKDARDYLQCAGSATAMTCETRTEADGEAQQYVIGRSEAERSGDPTVRIPWDEFEVVVYEDEVFTAAAAAELFCHYLKTSMVPPEFTLRPLQAAVDR